MDEVRRKILKDILGNKLSDKLLELLKTELEFKELENFYNHKELTRKLLVILISIIHTRDTIIARIEQFPEVKNGINRIKDENVRKRIRKKSAWRTD